MLRYASSFGRLQKSNSIALHHTLGRYVDRVEGIRELSRPVKTTPETTLAASDPCSSDMDEHCILHCRKRNREEADSNPGQPNTKSLTGATQLSTMR